RIYNDSTNKQYANIEGSTNHIAPETNFGVTNKSIKLTISDLDTDYLFYRIAIIEANNGSGQISGVKFTQEIPISIDTFTYTGNNYDTEGTEEEVLMFGFYVDK